MGMENATNECTEHFVRSEWSDYAHKFSSHLPGELEYIADLRHKHFSALIPNIRLLSFYIAVAYVAVIFSLRRWMKTRERYDLRYCLLGWNVFLSIFSAIGFHRVFTEMVYTLSTFGFSYSVCVATNGHGVSGFWTLLFILSKAPELVDTFFIVLRKQKLIFLHWYHHATVLVFCWSVYHTCNGAGRWFSTLNYFVHACMYGYYALRAARIYVPKMVNIILTTMQIVQMVIGIVTSSWGLYLVTYTSTHCSGGAAPYIWANLMYFSYFVLFANFFRQTYVKAPTKAATAAEGQTSAEKKHA